MAETLIKARASSSRATSETITNTKMNLNESEGRGQTEDWCSVLCSQRSQRPELVLSPMKQVKRVKSVTCSDCDDWSPSNLGGQRAKDQYPSHLYCETRQILGRLFHFPPLIGPWSRLCCADWWFLLRAIDPKHTLQSIYVSVVLQKTTFMDFMHMIVRATAVTQLLRNCSQRARALFTPSSDAQNKQVTTEHHPLTHAAA